MNTIFKYLCYGLCLLSPYWAAAQPEINVKGNGLTIADGANSPNTNDHTDFGAVVACPDSLLRTFTIENTGTANLTISSIQISPYAYNYPIRGIALPTTVLPGGSTTFTIAFYGVANEAMNRTVTIANNDSDEGNYDFAIHTQSTSPVTASIVTTMNISCAGGNDGSLTAQGTGGSGFHTFLWTPGPTTATITGLSAGIYTVTITDALGCYDDATSMMNQPTPISINPFINHILCNGGATGSISLAVTGGISPYAFLWSNGTNTSSINGLTAGNYSVTVTDANGCTAVGNYTLTQPNALSVTTSVTQPISCNGTATGMITANISGGTPAYTYLWNTGIMTAVVQNLPAAVYTVTVTDINGCTASSSINLTQPTALTVSASNVSDVTCNGGSDGSFTLVGNGGSPTYTYQINGLPATANATFTGLAAGTYSASVIDANGCTASQNVTIGEPTPVTISIHTIDLSCFWSGDGSATAIPSGGVPGYVYIWATGASAATDFGLQAGNYPITVLDANNCAAYATATIGGPQTPMLANAGADTTITPGGTAMLQGLSMNGNPPFTFLWTPGTMTAATQPVSPTATTSYALLITDSNGCTASDTVVVFVSSLPPSDTTLVNLLAISDTLSDCYPIVLPPLATYSVSCAPQYGTFTIDANLCYDYIPNGVNANVSDEVCLTICEGTYCQTYTLMIPLASCVFPGDADTNRVVDNFDLLPIGLGMGETGNVRDNASLNYDCQPVMDWATSTPTTLINYKHSDTDGDGLITNDDTLAIVQNWGLVHLRNGGASLTGNIPLYLDTVNCVCNLFPGETVAYPILLGDAANPVGDGYGFAFTLNYLQSQVEDGSIRIDFGGANWMGDKATGEVISIQKDFPQVGALKTAITRTNGVGVNGGFGQIGTLYFTIKDDILRENAVDLEMAFTDIRLISAQNEEMGTNPVPVVLSVRDTISTTVNLSQDLGIRLYPNPARTELRIESEQAMLESVAVYNALGQMLLYVEPQALRTSLSVSDWQEGVYWIEVRTSAGNEWRRVVKE